MDGIFSNPGRRIKGCAKALFVVEIIIAVIGGIAMIASDDDMFLFALLTIAIGIAAGFVTALFLYAFGELVESSQENRDINRQILHTLGGKAPQAPQAPPFPPATPPPASGTAVPAATPPPTPTPPALSAVCPNPVDTSPARIIPGRFC